MARRTFPRLTAGRAIGMLLFPLTGLVTTPVRLIQALWRSRVLAEGRWGGFPHFNAHMGLNSLFYWSAAVNLYRFGRRGVTPALGLGDYRLARLFHYTLGSLYAYWGAGAVTLLVGMGGWWLMHLLWLPAAGVGWTAAAMALVLASTTFYANTFFLQNYNALGWLFFPLGVHGLMTQNWLLAGIAWLAASFGSVTAVFVAGGLSAAAALTAMSLWPLVALGPAVAKLATHLLDLREPGGIMKTAEGLAKTIGASEGRAKYHRRRSRAELAKGLVFLGLYALFAAGCVVATGSIPWLFLAGMGIFAVNTYLVRFADVQTAYLMMLSLALATVLAHPGAWVLLVCLWLLASPPPLLFGLAFVGDRPDVVMRAEPFDLAPARAGVEALLAPIPDRSRLLFAFEDPQGVYEAIFDGYRTLLELPVYLAAKREILLVPTWWSVVDTNYEGAPDYWGRDPDAVRRNLEALGAEYVIVYQDDGEALDPRWQAAGFTSLATFDWNGQAEAFAGSRHAYPAERLPQWWLLRWAEAGRKD